MSQKKVAVFKYGSESVTNAQGVDLRRLKLYADQLSALPFKLVVISSGSVRTGSAEAPDVTDEQVLAALGSAEVVVSWKQAFKRHSIRASQLLVTHREIDDPKEGPVFQQAIRRNLALGVVPILNENDTLSRKELAELAYGGDNDGLASHAARTLDASILVLMTNVDGLLDRKGRLVKEVSYTTAAHAMALRYAGGKDDRGQGMHTKVRAAINAAAGGIDAYIAKAGEDIVAILAGEKGTHVVKAPNHVE